MHALTLSNGTVSLSMLPEKGADIYSLIDSATGLDVLFKSPWGVRSPAGCSAGASSFERFMQSYPGGWQLLLPNGGDECVERGATWGFHGEAALAPWTVRSAESDRAVLEVRLVSAPLHVRREVLLLGAVVRVEETVTNDSPEPLEVMWSHHPAFGAPFLGGGCVLSAGCTTFLADDRQPGTLFGAGTSHRWPLARSVAGDTVDLRTIPPPSQPRAVLGYLTDFSSGFFALTNPRLGLGVGLRWDTDVLDKAWLWQEVCSGQDWPWFRRAYVVAVEPASTIPGQGMTNARAKGQAGVRLGAGESKRLVVEAVLYRGSTGVSGIDEGGRVQFEDR